MMKSIAIGGICALIGLCTAFQAHALTLEWDRNVDDAVSYGVYGCFVKGCTVLRSPATLVAVVPQPGAGTVPSWSVTPGKEGALAVTARDAALNESPLSVSVFFDAVAPSIPANPVLK